MPKGALSPAQAVMQKTNTPRGAAHYAHRPVGSERFNPATGYWMIKTAEPKTWEKRCRVRVARSLGRPLLPGESVHHLNGDRTDDRLENLVVLHQRDHIKEHRPERSRRPDWAQRASSTRRSHLNSCP